MGLDPYGDTPIATLASLENEEEEHANRRTFEFEIAKLGFTLEKNAVVKLDAELQAQKLGVQVGYVISKVNNNDVAANKLDIMAAVKEACKTGALKFEFRFKNKPEAHCCSKCDKFFLQDIFSADELEKGPGVHKCNPCVEAEDFCAMFE